MVTIDEIKKLKSDISCLTDKQTKLQELTNEYIKDNAIFNKDDLVLVCGDKTRINNKMPKEFYITNIGCMRLYDDKIQYGYIDNVDSCGSFVHYISLDAEIILLKPATVEQLHNDSDLTIYKKIKDTIIKKFFNKE